jgi:hypothetical protein
MRTVCRRVDLRLHAPVSHTMKKTTIAGILLMLLCVSPAFGQGRGARGGAGGAAGAAAADQTPPNVFVGCVSGGNLQPVEQPFMLEPSQPFVLIEVLTRATSGFSPTNYRVTGVNLTPWLGMRVRVEGTLVQPRQGAIGVDALPEVKATRVTSTWGTCPSPAAWTPPKP